MEPQETTMIQGKILVIYIDIDDDLGRVGIETPIVGEEGVRRVIDIASNYLASDSDFNTMVVSYNVYKKLKSNPNNDVEIAFISGSTNGGLKAHTTFASKLEEVLRKVQPIGAVVVYDSPEDESAVPIIQSRIPIYGVERVIVEQSRGVEETYVLFAKYIKKAVSDPKYSRIFLGIPGIALVLIAILSIFNLLSYAGIVLAMLIGVAMLVRGLSIDDAVEKWWENSPIMVISAILSLISLVIALVNGVLISSQFNAKSVEGFSALMLGILPYLAFTVVILAVGKMVSRLISRDLRVWHDILSLSTIIVGYYIISGVLRQLELGKYELSLQLVYELIVSSIVLISIYVGLSHLEKRFTYE